MTNQNKHFRHILLFYFRKGSNASQAYKKLCAVYGDEAVKEGECENWFGKFRSGDFSLTDEDFTERPVEVDVDQIKAIIHTDRHSSTEDIAYRLNVSLTCIQNHLKQLGFRKLLDVWVPRNLSEQDLMKRISLCDMLLKRNSYDPFLKRMITGDEVCIVYISIRRKKPWMKENEKQATLSVWWDHKGVLYFDMLPKYQTINPKIYSEHLNKLNNAIKQKRPELANRKGIVFYHDHFRPHTSLVSRQKLMELGWDVLPKPPYSPDLAPSDYHLFLPVKNFLNGKKFLDDSEVKIQLELFFTVKNREFYEEGIMVLPEKWQKVINNNGHYIQD